LREADLFPVMSWVVYWVVRGAVALLQALPLRFVAFLGRAGGFAWWMFDLKHRALVIVNLKQAFPDKNRSEIAGIARETFQRIAENALAAVKTAAMRKEDIFKICEVAGAEKFPKRGDPGAPGNCVAAVGHFGNFELYATFGTRVTGWQGATTYRGMNQPWLHDIVQEIRERSGCWFFERRTQAGALKEALSKGGILLGLLSDQRPVKGGVEASFMGRPCATTAAPAVFALRYDAPLFTIVCYRVGLGRWCMEVGDEIPLRENGRPRTMEAIMADVNRAFEAAVRRDPANWFWVHDRWKKPRVRRGSDVPAAALEEGLGSPSV
jgi:lauroyl/myristoyl acyltransferase